MIKIYFDDKLLNEDSYSQLLNEYQVLDDNFTLGGTASNTYTLSLNITDDLIIPNKIYIYDDDTLIDTLFIDECEYTDDSYTLKLKDIFIKMNEEYHITELFKKLGREYATLTEIVQDICDKYDLTLGTTDFNGNDKVVSWYDDTIHAREIISYIAELNSGFARIENGILYFIKQKMTSKANILKDDCSDFSIGDRHKITGVVYDIGTEIWQRGDNTGSVIYINTDNIFITDESDIVKIYNDIKGLEFYSFDPQDCPMLDYSIKGGDIITFINDDESQIPIIANITREYFGQWTGKYYLSVNSTTQETTQVKDTNQNIKSIKTRLNRDEAQLKIIAEQSDKATQKVTELDIEVGKLSAKVETIADVTIKGETSKRLTLDNLLAVPLVRLEVKANISTINNTYLKTGLQEAILNEDNELVIKHPWSVGDYLTSKRIKIYNDTYLNYYDLPILWHLDDEHYDEYVYDYTEKKIKITRRVKAEKTTIDNLEVYKLSALATEIIEEIEITDENTFMFPEDGTYNFELLTGPNYVAITAMIKNDYTSQFATKVELSGEVKILDNSIEAEVKRATDSEKEINGKLELKIEESDITPSKIVSKINASADEITLAGGSRINLTTPGKLLISAGNFKLDEGGNMTCNDANVNNVNINGGNIVLTSTEQQPKLSIIDNEKDTCRIDIGARKLLWTGANNGYITIANFTPLPSMIFKHSDNYQLSLSPVNLTFTDSIGNNTINMTNPGNIACVSLNANNQVNTPMITVSKNNGQPILKLERNEDTYSATSTMYISANQSGELTMMINDNPAVRLSNSYFRPDTNNGSTTLGSSNYRWGQIYSTSSSISTSDKNLKENISEYDERYEELFNNLRPVKFKFKGKEHDRIHSGFISQDVEEAIKKSNLTTNDFAAFCKDIKTGSKIEYDENGNEILNNEYNILDKDGNNEYLYSLRYEEFISLNTWQIQKQKERINNLEKQIEELKEMINNEL